MKLKRMKLQNFKQYYGTQIVEFAGYNDSKNVTVFFGENGRGKTTIYRGIMYCLYGDTLLDQDKNEKNTTKNDDMYLVNKKALEEDFNNEGIKASVTLEFSDNGQDYIIYRSLFGILLDDKIDESQDELKLTLVNSDGNATIYEKTHEDKIEEIVNSILAKSIRSYFLFDGEKIDKLTKATAEHRVEISNGIKNLLKMDEFNVAVNGITKLESKLREDLKKVADEGDYTKILNEIENKELLLKTKKTKRENIINKLEKARHEKNQLEESLMKYAEFETLVAENKNLQNDIDQYIELKDNKRQQIIKFNNKGYILLADTLLDQSYTKVSEFSNVSLTQANKENIYEYIKEKMVCICGDKITFNDSKFQHIKEWSEDKSNAVDNGRILEYRDYIIRNQERIGNYSNEIELIIEEYLKIENTLSELRNKKKINQEKLDKRQVDDKEINSNNARRKSLEEDISKYLLEEKDLKKEIEKISDEIEIDKVKKKELEKELNIKGDVKEVYDLVENLLSNLKNIYQEFVDEIREKLGEIATQLFKQFIDEKTKTTFSKVIVNDNYSLDILNWNGESFLANISRGQRQILSLAFIIALAQVAGDETSIEIPLFMDTPFGRISGENRDNLIMSIPKLTPQWILLATDTELGRVEIEKLREGGNWGKIYKIEMIENGYSKLVEENVNTFTVDR